MRRHVYRAYEHPLPEAIPPDEVVEQSAQLSFPYGNCEIRRWLFQGIKINYTKNHFLDRFYFEKENPDRVVSLSFNLKGNYSIYQNGQTYCVKGGQHNIVHSKGYSNTFENMDLQGESFIIELEPEAFYPIAQDGNDVLKRFLDSMQRNEPAVLSPTSLFISPDLRKAIQAILYCPFSGNMKKLFLLSKSMEILVLQAEAYDQWIKAKKQYCTRQDDQERLMQAQKYMEENLQHPPTLSELARIIGLNEYKLKRGFKELFQTTVFGYLSDQRLEKARQDLLDSNKTIKQIAFSLGYSSPQHFSSAFRKKFGLSPKNCRQ